MNAHQYYYSDYPPKTILVFLYLKLLIVPISIIHYILQLK